MLVKKDVSLIIIFSLFLFYGCLKNTSKTSDTVENVNGECWYVYPISSDTKGYCSIKCNTCPSKEDVANYNRDKTNNKIKSELCPIITEGENKNIKFLEGKNLSLDSGKDPEKDSAYNSPDKLYIKYLEYSSLEENVAEGEIPGVSLNEDENNIKNCSAAYETHTTATVARTEANTSNSLYGILRCYNTIEGIVYYENNVPQLIWKILPLSGDKNFEEFNTFISNPNNTGGFRLATKEECKKPNVTSLIKLDNFCRSTRRCNFLLHRAEHDPRGDKSGFWLSDQRDSEYQHVCNARGTVSESSKTNIKLSLFVLVKEYSSYSCRWGRQYQSIEKLRNN